MTNGIFKRSGYNSYARATTVMSTQSETVFAWSVKLIRGAHFAVGIASKLEKDTCIYDFDREAILFHADGPFVDIRRGLTKTHSGLKPLHSGDVISFRFQPVIKKLIINWVRTRDSSSTNL